MSSIQISTTFSQSRTACLATEMRPDFKLIFKIFLPKCVCFRGSAPDPAGGLQRPPDPQLENVGSQTNPSPPTFLSGSTPLKSGQYLYIVRVSNRSHIISQDTWSYECANIPVHSGMLDQPASFPAHRTLPNFGLGSCMVPSCG